MKKFISSALSLAMIMALSVNAFAGTIEKDNGSEGAPVKATYVAGAKAPDVISTDITWGSLEFTYTDASYEWNADTMKYDEIKAAVWACTDGADKITVENRGNVKVNVNVSAAAEVGYEAVNLAFYKNDTGSSPVLSSDAALEAADKKAGGTTAEFQVVPSGKLDSATPAATPINTVTVKISKTL